MSKTNKITPKVPRKPHPKKYTDPIEDVDKYVADELEWFKCVFCGSSLGSQGWCNTCKISDD